MLGSTEFVEDYMTLLQEKMVAYINVDVAASGNSNFKPGRIGDEISHHNFSRITVARKDTPVTQLSSKLSAIHYIPYTFLHSLILRYSPIHSTLLHYINFNPIYTSTLLSLNTLLYSNIFYYTSLYYTTL